MNDDLGSRSGAVPGDVTAGEVAGVPEPPPRRRFLAYLIAAPVLVMGVKLGTDVVDAPAADAAVASIPTPPLPADIIDLGDILILAAAPTADMLTLTVNSDGTVDFELPREEVGQGITTAIAMIIADEMGIALSSVHMHLQPATPALLFNQITGGSNSIRSLYTPVRTVAAAAKGRLLAAAAGRMNVHPGELTISEGVMRARDGRTVGYGAATAAAADPALVGHRTALKPASAQTITGTPTNRIDALDMVTGAKKYALDLAPAGSGRDHAAAVHGPPPADDQRHRRVGRQRRGRQGHARHSRRDHDPDRGGGGGQDVRPVPGRGGRAAGHLGPGHRGPPVQRHGGGGAEGGEPADPAAAAAGRGDRRGV